RLPQYFGNLTNDLVYRRLAPNVLESLQAMNPKDEKGRRKAKLHQGLTEHAGLQRLQQHHGTIIALAALCDDGDYKGFKKLLDRVAPVHEPEPLFDQTDGN